ncbi:MAG: SUMF1/EgtB/PvdO family nonheme iron enzyme [Polyangiaceae bacterium]
MRFAPPRLRGIGAFARACCAAVALGGLGLFAVENAGCNNTSASGAQGSTSAVASATEVATVASSAPSTAVVASASAPPRPVHPDLPEPDLIASSIPEQRAAMVRRMKVMLRLDDTQVAKLEQTLADSISIVGQGNPAITEYAMTRKECIARRQAADALDADDPQCGGPYMVPVWDPTVGQTKADAKLCIDQFEYPDIPCEYPMTWVSAREAALLCDAVGKRLCDAHEWEGACAGAVHDPDTEYVWNRPRKEAKSRHNKEREIVWAYGAKKDHTKCAMASKKTKTCQPSGFKKCGSNTYPAGSFPDCKSPFGVFDQHGNVAEHMNLPLRPSELASRGGMGETEMKGSWFIFQTYEAHEDDCRWRAPDWHVTKVMSRDSHQNYHLGFRCCKDIGAAAKPESASAPAPSASASANPPAKKKGKKRAK